MNNKLIIIDPSRGGEDIGNISNDIIEKNFNLEISKYIYDRLKELNIPVAIIRDKDETLNITNRINRIKTSSKEEESILISNALTKGGNGVEIVYSIRNDITLAGLIAKELDRLGIKISKIYQRRLPRDINQDYNEIIRETPDSESIIIYYGSIDNEENLKYLTNISDLGEAVVKAIAHYLKVKYTPIIKDYIEYKTTTGDSLYSIARRFNVTVKEIKELNNLTTNLLSIGKTLKIPQNNLTNN